MTRTVAYKGKENVIIIIYKDACPSSSKYACTLATYLNWLVGIKLSAFLDDAHFLYN